jgi:hypothetical protein
MTKGIEELPESSFAALVPEFVVGDLATSLCFWCDVLGFRVAYQRSEDNFAYLERGRAQVMLEVSGGNWQTGDWERPLGRGINFQILVESLQPLIDALAGASGRCSVRRMTPGIGSVTKREACANFSCRTPTGTCCDLLSHSGVGRFRGWPRSAPYSKPLSSPGCARPGSRKSEAPAPARSPAVAASRRSTGTRPAGRSRAGDTGRSAASAGSGADRKGVSRDRAVRAAPKQLLASLGWRPITLARNNLTVRANCTLSNCSTTMTSAPARAAICENSAAIY